MGVEAMNGIVGATELVTKVPATVAVAPVSAVKQATTVSPAENASSNQTGTGSGSSAQSKYSEEQLKKAIAYANKNIKMDCEFTYHEKINRVSIKIFNSETKEVIREIPAEEALEMVEKFYEMAGIIVDEKR